MAELKTEHLSPTEEITLETVKQRAVRGVAVLTGRTFLFSLISLFATGLLTYYLAPNEFGVFWIVSAVVNFLAYFSDVGLAAALIQKKEKLSREDLSTTFTVQQALVVSLLVILFAATPLIQRVYNLSGAGVYLLYALGISLFLSSLKTIPSVLLERELEFGKLTIPQVLENLTYNLLAVFFAWKGFGVTSFTYAILARGVVGFIAMYILKPWIPQFGISRESLKKLLTFGVPYQLNTFLAVVKDDGMTAFLGGVLGAYGVGLLGWAQKWGYAPLRFFMDHVIKVTFPAFARMQDEKEELARTTTRSIFFICFLVFPSVVGLLVIAPILVDIIPRYEKWAPALIPLSLIAVNTIFASVTTQLTNLLNSIGKIKTTFKLILFWTVATWLLVPFLSIKYGVNGAAFAYALIGTTSIAAIYIVRRIVKFSLADSALKPAIAASLMGILLFTLRRFLPINLTSIWILIVTGSVIYILTTYFLVGSSILADAKKTFSNLFSK